MKRPAAILILLVFTACGPRDPRTVKLDREFDLRVGEQANLDNGRMSVTFVSLVNDSRCPADVDCFHGGDASIQLFVTGDEGERSMILNTRGRMPHDGRYGPYSIQLTGLGPYPRTDRWFAEREYGATLRITR